VSPTCDALPDVLSPPRRWWSIVSLLLGRDHRRCQERGVRQRRWGEWGHASVRAVLNGVTGICLEGRVRLFFRALDCRSTSVGCAGGADASDSAPARQVSYGWQTLRSSAAVRLDACARECTCSPGGGGGTLTRERASGATK